MNALTKLSIGAPNSAIAAEPKAHWLATKAPQETKRESIAEGNKP